MATVCTSSGHRSKAQFHDVALCVATSMLTAHAVAFHACRAQPHFVLRCLRLAVAGHMANDAI